MFAEISCSVRCPYEDDVSSEKVPYLARLMRNIDIQCVDVVDDTVDLGTSRRVQHALEAALRYISIDQSASTSIIFMASL